MKLTGFGGGAFSRLWYFSVTASRFIAFTAVGARVPVTVDAANDSLICAVPAGLLTDTAPTCPSSSGIRLTVVVGSVAQPASVIARATTAPGDIPRSTP